MKRIRRVLHATDFSPASRRAFDTCTRKKSVRPNILRALADTEPIEGGPCAPDERDGLLTSRTILPPWRCPDVAPLSERSNGSLATYCGWWPQPHGRMPNSPPRICF
jgi:hypothetical protein